jgi:NAD(P)-dependent dehydrogenase (short-subunit alcohol dehydrogenase family)
VNVQDKYLIGGGCRQYVSRPEVCRRVAAREIARDCKAENLSDGLMCSFCDITRASGLDRVVATARKPEQLNDLSEKYGGRLLALAVDVTDSEAVIGAVAAGHKAFGSYDIVVNNAGYGDTASIEDTTIESFEKQIATNFLGVVYVTKAVLPILREQRAGHIFQVSSVGGRVGSPGLGAYQSAKWAMGGFSTVLAQEVAPFGIKVTVLEPGGMKTDWAGSSMTIPPVSAPYEQTVGVFAKMLRDYSGSEPTDPAKVAQIVLQLANQDDVPLRLLLGTDAVQYAPTAAKALAESDAKWHELSVSVGV